MSVVDFVPPPRDRSSAARTRARLSSLDFVAASAAGAAEAPRIGADRVLGVSVGIQDGRRGAPKNIFQVVARAVCAAQKHQLEVWERHADLVLRPDVGSLAWDDFHRVDEAIEAGAAAARRALPRLQRFLHPIAERTDDFDSDSRSRLWLAEVMR